jgi:hypothetical protein
MNIYSYIHCPRKYLIETLLNYREITLINQMIKINHFIIAKKMTILQKKEDVSK